VDATLLTIDVKRTRGPGAQRAREMLSSVGAHVLGVVANAGGDNPPRWSGRCRFVTLRS